MIELTRKIVFKQTARLLIVASVLCVLFEHGDVHAFVHTHSEDQTQNHSHAEEFDDKDAHQHPTASVDLTGTLTQKTTSKADTNPDPFSAPDVLSSQRTLQSPVLLYLDLPPPDHLNQSTPFSSYSLRGPPLG